MNKLCYIILLTALIAACGANRNRPAAAENWEEEIPRDEILENRVLTAEQQQALTPDEVIEVLRAGNRDFVDDNLTIRNNSVRVRDAAMGQYPIAVVLSCLDSRVPVEDVFHRGIGDIFVARVAGNISNTDILGSLEYACRVSGSKVVMVLGHGHCGAIKSAIDGVELGNITHLLEKIKPAVEHTLESYDGMVSSSNYELVDRVCYANVVHTVADIRRNSPILAGMERDGEIRIIGGVYDMHTGEVDFMDDI
ncbi:MAG: carbonic anhydrase [Rikenellaceae bacterium]|nr:carbonic anhydrase [Rikenellaceae bacterium]